VLGDSRRLTQVVSNLINNAIKFTPQGEISLKVDLLDRGTGSVTVRIVVSDTGIGIAPKDQHRIFEPFVQADMSHTRSYGGTGLGLSICNKLVERMGGSISLESEAGAGSRFTIELPFVVTDPVAEPAASGTAVEFTPTGSTVLVAEDNLINLKATSGMLRKMVYTVVCAADGKEALAHWMQGGIDVVLMDIQMPVMDGIEAMQFIRAREQNSGCHTPVVALTAHAMQEDRERLLKAGFDGYLAKPVEAQTLINEISRVVHTRSMHAI
jgi:CheY-like chemotaxis protein/anti-sigma regulatory factor (Ser/Thr protein kinase)